MSATAEAVATAPAEVTIAESEWQRLKRCEWHLKHILGAVRIKAVADQVEAARMFYESSTGPVVIR